MVGWGSVVLDAQPTGWDGGLRVEDDAAPPYEDPDSQPRTSGHRSWAGRAQAIEAPALVGHEDLGEAVAVEVGQHGLADPAAQGKLPEHPGPPRAFRQRVQVSVGASHEE